MYNSCKRSIGKRRRTFIQDTLYKQHCNLKVNFFDVDVEEIKECQVSSFPKAVFTNLTFIKLK